MKKLFIVAFLCTIGSGELAGITNRQHPRSVPNGSSEGDLAPNPTFLVTIEGKSFYLGTSTRWNRTEAFSFCNSHGLRLAEITSSVQFEVLGLVQVEGWHLGDVAWICGVMMRDLKPYVWESSNTSLDHSYLPFEDSLTEEYRVSLIFVKNGIRPGDRSFISSLFNYITWTQTLCETSAMECPFF